MKTKLQRAQTLADAVRNVQLDPVSWDNMSDEEQRSFDRMNEALKAYDDAATEQGPEPAPLDRDALGRQVRYVWIAWAYEQPSPKPSWLVPYHLLTESDKEVDRRIGEVLFRMGQQAAQPPQPEAKPGVRGFTYEELEAQFDALRGQCAELTKQRDNALDRLGESIGTLHKIELREVAKPADWMRASTAIARWAYGYYNAGDCQREALAYWDGVGKHLPGPAHTVEVVQELLAKHAPHCPNAAGDAREVSAKELIDWLIKRPTYGDQAIDDECNAKLIGRLLAECKRSAERAKASQTPSDHA